MQVVDLFFFFQAMETNPSAAEAWKRRGQARAALGEFTEVLMLPLSRLFVIQCCLLRFLICDLYNHQWRGLFLFLCTAVNDENSWY